MDAFRFHSLCKHWRDHPPVHISVAAYVYGGKRKDVGGAETQPLEMPAAQSAGAILDSLTTEEENHVR